MDFENDRSEDRVFHAVDDKSDMDISALRDDSAEAQPLDAETKLPVAGGRDLHHWEPVVCSVFELQDSYIQARIGDTGASNDICSEF